MRKEFQKERPKYGLLGKNISYSFSRGYFSNKFKQEGIRADYVNFDIPDISDFPQIIKANPTLKGLNVTIPYKEEVLKFLDEIDPEAEAIGAVNTIKILENGQLKGYNTDHVGFAEALKPFLKSWHKKALVLGTGGASKAIVHALKELKIQPTLVSRRKNKDQITYEDLDQKSMHSHLLIVNCTPLGTTPDTERYPPIPVQYISEKHLIFDLIYNPPATHLMQLAEKKGATTSNGLRMLELQAEESWEHWNKIT